MDNTANKEKINGAQFCCCASFIMAGAKAGAGTGAGVEAVAGGSAWGHGAEVGWGWLADWLACFELLKGKYWILKQQYKI